jgi:preprotein translocase subunit YajC
MHYFLTLMALSLSTAASAATSQTASNPMSMLPMMLIFVGLFYFMIIRPQNNRRKEQTQLISSLKPGDEVSTLGGIIGQITTVEGNIVQLKIAKDVVVSIHETSINKQLPKGSFKTTPSKAKK